MPRETLSLWKLKYERVLQLSDYEREWCMAHLCTNDNGVHYLRQDWLDELSEEAKKACSNALMSHLKKLIEQYGTIDVIVSRDEALETGGTAPCVDCERIFRTRGEDLQLLDWEKDEWLCMSCDQARTDREYERTHETPGALSECPDCGGQLQTTDREDPDYKTMLQSVSCLQCDAQFSELYEVVNWKRDPRESGR